MIEGKPVRSYGGFDFRMDDKDLYKAFNEALVAFKKTDDYKKILTSYGLSPTRASRRPAPRRWPTSAPASRSAPRLRAAAASRRVAGVTRTDRRRRP